MDKATIQAAIDKADEQQALNFAAMQRKGSEINENRRKQKDIIKAIAELQGDLEQVETACERLKDDLTKLKVKEGNIIGTKKAFTQMLTGIE